MELYSFTHPVKMLIVGLYELANKRMDPSPSGWTGAVSSFLKKTSVSQTQVSDSEEHWFHDFSKIGCARTLSVERAVTRHGVLNILVSDSSCYKASLVTR